jgi:hypothetical protein
MFPLLSIGCLEKQSSFKKLECYPLDTAVNDNLKRIFKPCREFIYSAKYWDSEYNLISDEHIWMMATGKSWDVQPELQNELIIQYDYNESKVDIIRENGLNKELLEREWSRIETTGVIETEVEVFLHPFRQNQYVFTEVVGFPEMRSPIKEGKTWTANLNIHEGWGDWENSTLKSTYQIIGLDSLELPFIKLEAWHVRVSTLAEFGNSKHDFWYNEEFGFVKMIIKNYEDQLLVFELEEVKEN